MPRTAPAKVSISPNAARTEASIIPIGGTKKAAKISTAPNDAIQTAKINCNCCFILFFVVWFDDAKLQLRGGADWVLWGLGGTRHQIQVYAVFCVIFLCTSTISGGVKGRNKKHSKP